MIHLFVFTFYLQSNSKNCLCLSVRSFIRTFLSGVQLALFTVSPLDNIWVIVSLIVNIKNLVSHWQLIFLMSPSG